MNSEDVNRKPLTIQVGLHGGIRRGEMLVFCGHVGTLSFPNETESITPNKGAQPMSHNDLDKGTKTKSETEMDPAPKIAIVAGGSFKGLNIADALRKAAIESKKTACFFDDEFNLQREANRNRNSFAVEKERVRSRKRKKGKF